MSHKASNFQPIENYGLIGNMCSAALVSVDCSIDFFCFPRFDSPTVFAALLDPEQGGCFSLQPAENNVQRKQMYLAETNVLLTRFLSESASAEVTDFLPVTSSTQKNMLIRRVSCVHGHVRFRMLCQPAFDYARASHQVLMDGDDAVFTPDSGVCNPMRLQGTAELQLEGGAVTADFELEKGQTATFIFGSDAEMKYTPLNTDRVTGYLDETLRYWRDWSAKSQYRGRWREAVSRSALLLKLLTSREFGSLIAAPTFGLPERVGGERNWDYRFTWMRDSAFTLYAFMRLGYREEADNFLKWLRDRIGEAAADRSPMQVMYGLDGRTDLTESQLDHFRGYRDSKPVRIGNNAFGQLQLDIYGEFFDAVYLYSKYGHAVPHDGWNNVKRILAWLGANWQQPDDGIWEIRSETRDLLHSRLMCWVAFDRAIRLAHKRSLSAPLPEWYKQRDAIVDDIYNNFWSEELQCFVQSKDSKVVDAALLLMPLMRFISPIDPKWLSTLDAIERQLSEDAFVYRYRQIDSGDGLAGEEGSFTCCSFWLVECYARANQAEKARILFDKLLAHGNHLGLFSEEIGRDGRQLGNFPQALTHLALISAATYLDRALSKTEPKPWE